MITDRDIKKAAILIVDDQATNVALLKEMLRDAGYESVMSTTDPLAVCNLHRNHHFDLILLDLQMPGMDGFAVMEQLKAFETGSYVPILVITAQPSHKMRALKSGAKDFISKPFDLAEVLARVHNMIEVRLLHENGTVLNVGRLQNAQRIAGLGDWEYDFAKNHRLRWSDEVYNILGISKNEAPPSSETFHRMVHPDDIAYVKREKELAASGLRKVDFEHRIIRRDGEIRNIHQVAEMFFDDLGQPTRESGTIQDITERKQAEFSLAESEERYRKMLTLSPDSLFVHVDGLITFVNKAFCVMMGADDPSELIGRVGMEVVHPADQDFVRSRLLKRERERFMPPIEIRFVRLDGGFVDVEATSVAFDFRGHKEIQVIARDISARKAAVSDLRESEERFKIVARAMSDVVWDWNLQTNELWFNEGFQPLGYAAGELEHSFDSWMSHIHPDERGRVSDSLRAAIDSSAETWTSEYHFKRKDGSFASVSARGFILRDAHNKPIRMAGGLRDLTEQKRIEAQYLRAQRMESIGTLAGGIAHDLNNVLAPILMAIELLKQDAEGDDRRTKILDTIHLSCRRGADLVRQVLSFARGVDEQRVAIQLNHLFDELGGIIKHTFPLNIRIDLHAAKDLWPIIGDPTQLHQLLLNLVVNARDAMEHGGTLTLAATNVKVDAQFAATSRGAKAGSYVLIEATDTGCGIPESVREKIFEPFFTTKAEGKGTGLGLATVQMVVKSHGGFLSVESEVERGSTFRIYIPADPAYCSLNLARPFEADIPRGRDELILVVDDESSIREITQQTLESFGYRVIVAGDGAAAVAIYAKRVTEISLVLIDMMMPIMDGSATIHVLRCINPAVKIIAASGLELTENIARATGAGVTDFLLKPYTAEVLFQRVRNAIDRPELVTA
jgi:PAS domain S-box-containing protein